MIAAPVVALAQPAQVRPPKRVVLCLGPSNAPDPIGPTRQWYAKEFAGHGVADGKDIEIVILRAKSMGAVAAAASVRQAVALRADVIMTHMSGSFAKKFLLPLTGQIPLVLVGNDDGFEDSIEMMNRRGENVTGAMYSYFDLVLKRFELMKELLPNAKRAALVIREGPEPPTEWSESQKRRSDELLAAGARKLGLEFSNIELQKDISAEALVRALRHARIDLVEFRQWGFIETKDGDGDAFWGSLAATGIGASGVGPGTAQAGALMGGWSAGWMESSVRLAARIVRGQRAAAIPVERPMEYGLAINLRTARTLGITIPPSLLLRANKVFE